MDKTLRVKIRVDSFGHIAVVNSMKKVVSRDLPVLNVWIRPSELRSVLTPSVTLLLWTLKKVLSRGLPVRNVSQLNQVSSCTRVLTL